MNNSDIEKINNLLATAEGKISTARELLLGKEFSVKAEKLGRKDDDKQVVEGVYNGQAVIAPDKSEYLVPVNYASKSKLLPGDLLKLSIHSDGSYLFKQIGPVPRRRAIAELEEEEGSYFVVIDDCRYKLLQASVTYFKANPGDSLAVIIPADSPSDYAAVENVIKSK
jgi:hypothetical protein